MKSEIFKIPVQNILDGWKQATQRFVSLKSSHDSDVIDWAKAIVIDRQSDRPTSWIKEAIHIYKEGQQATNHDKGSYQLSHAYDRFPDTTAVRCVRIQKNWVPAFFWWRPLREVDTWSLKKFWLCNMNLCSNSSDHSIAFVICHTR